MGLKFSLTDLLGLDLFVNEKTTAPLL